MTAKLVRSGYPHYFHDWISLPNIY